MNRATFTLDDEASAFLAKAGGRNKSAFVSWLLKEEKARRLRQAVLKANKEEADEAYQRELAEWDETLSDGLS